jgi:redox-sensitive bicupin YhaK (pirin superfamily)
MSNLDQAPAELECGSEAAPGPVREMLTGHEVALGGVRAMTVTRTLPTRGRRMVGAWCFADAYGPTDLTTHPGMLVPPHPHTALQTVSWLVEGAVLHRDSLGTLQLIRPGQLNLMTAGRGIAHSEESAPAPTPFLHGVQLWVALPGSLRDVEPHFEHHAELPVHRDDGVDVTVLMGSMGEAVSPARTYTPIFGGDAALSAGASARLPLVPGFEYAALSLAGTIRVDGVELGSGPLLYLGAGRAVLDVAAPGGPARLLLIGGEPFAEQIVMWWNFVGRSHGEIVAARADWMSGISGGTPERFGVVTGFEGAPLPAPTLPNARLKPRGRER